MFVSGPALTPSASPRFIGVLVHRNHVRIREEVPEKRPKLSKSLETLTAANPILEEIGVAGFGGSSASAASSSSSSRFNGKAAANKKGPVVLPPRARLLRAATGLQNTEDSQVDEDEQ